MDPGSGEAVTLHAIEWIITGIFIAEFGTRLWAAPSRPLYGRDHAIDLISFVPPVSWLGWFGEYRVRPVRQAVEPRLGEQMQALRRVVMASSPPVDRG